MAGNSLEELTRAGARLTTELDFKALVSGIVEQSIDITKSDLACLYIKRQPEERVSDLALAYKRGRFPAPDTLDAGSELIEFIREADEAVVLLGRKKSPFSDLFLDDSMQSGMALPLSTPKAAIGLVVLNSREPEHYNRDWFHFLNSYSKLAGGMLLNSKMVQQIKAYLKEIEELEIYQQNIFASMSNLLVTTDKNGVIQYFNHQAEKSLHLTPADIGRDISEVFLGTLDKGILEAVESANADPGELPSMEGIFHAERDMDFSLTVSPLRGAHGKHLGLTLLFTDETKQKDLEKTITHVVEERRMIKNMFSLYLSEEVVSKLTEQPQLVKPGGDKKEATIFFADIRGYTSFSEGRDPEYIIDVLNAYFTEAVEVVIKYHGYIDKFIGDAIMAVWGVPLQTAKEDAIDAVSCALEIQDLISSAKKRFFQGEASILKVGIGMHTGPLVAGNLGSPRRMNYTVIGDTVNVAARLEGVAKAGEVIITQKTKSMLEDKFIVEEREPVKVKGKAEAIPIFKVVKRKQTPVPVAHGS